MERPAIVRGVNRLIVRVETPDPLFLFLTRQLLLPAAWPITNNGIYTSGGIHLGNLDLEIMQLGQANGRESGSVFRPRTGLGRRLILGRGGEHQTSQRKARLYGITFDFAPYETALPELDERGILHTSPMPFYQVDDQGWQVTTWTSVFLGGLIGDTAAQRVFFAYANRLDKEIWERGSLPSSRNSRFGMPYIFNSLYRQGATFSIDYNPVWRASNLKTEPIPSGLDVIGVYEVTVGAQDLEHARACWKALLDPYPEIAPNVWELPNNLHIHLVSHPRDALVGMIWQVASLNRAAQFLHRRALPLKESSTGITLQADEMLGMPVRLVQ